MVAIEGEGSLICNGLNGPPLVHLVPNWCHCLGVLGSAALMEEVLLGHCHQDAYYAMNAKGHGTKIPGNTRLLEQLWQNYQELTNGFLIGFKATSQVLARTKHMVKRSQDKGHYNCLAKWI